jgi:hypothetical protein
MVICQIHKRKYSALGECRTRETRPYRDSIHTSIATIAADMCPACRENHGASAQLEFRWYERKTLAKTGPLLDWALVAIVAL